MTKLERDLLIMLARAIKQNIDTPRSMRHAIDELQTAIMAEEPDQLSLKTLTNNRSGDVNQ